jgi:LPS-assembly lipoprotein
MPGGRLRPGATTRRSAAGAVLLGVAALLGGCGFHVQGRVPLPASLQSVWIETEDAQSDFVVDLKRALRASGAAIATRREGSSATLRIERDELAERVLSVSGRNIPRELELTYTVRLAVEGSGGRMLIPSEQFAVSRDQTFTEELLLAKEREQEILSAALARDLVGVVMRRLSSLP